MKHTKLTLLLRNKTTILVVALMSLSIIIAFSNYYRLPLSGLSDLMQYGIHFAILSSALTGILILSSVNRWVFLTVAPFILLLSITSACSLYFYNITITSEIIEVVLKTDWSVSKEFISPQLILLTIGVLFIIFLTIRFRFLTPKENLKISIVLIIISVLMISPAVILNTYRNNTIIKRAPFSLIDASREYHKVIKLSKLKRNIIAEDAQSTSEDSLTVLLILGESVRNDHLTFNGYTRNTTPRLSQRDIYTFKQNRSLYTHTAASIPQLLTRADSTSPSLAFSEESLLSIFSRVGFKTTWIANQIPDYTYATLAKSCDNYINLSANTNTYSDRISTDQNIIDYLDKTKKTTKRNLVVMHTIGAHWYYNYRCPKERRQFTPTTKSRSFASNSPEQMINSYDNAILFMDYFIDQIIIRYKNENTILIYVSDHGETLGEDERWLHAFEHETLYNAACFMWMSEKYKENNSFSKAALINTKKRSNTSAIFHTALHAAGISTDVFDYKKSLLSEEYKEN